MVVKRIKLYVTSFNAEAELAIHLLQTYNFGES